MMEHLTAALRVAYRGRVADTARRLNLNDYYWKLLAITSPSIREYSVSEASADFYVSDGSELRQVVHGSNEEDILLDFVNELRETDVFFDIGANIGIYSLLAADIIIPKNVHAFEPNPPVARRLLSNAELNGTSIRHHDTALSDTSGESAFTVVDGGASPHRGQLADSGEMMVETVRADELIATGEASCPDVVKVDVEGLEHAVLEGFGDWLDDVRVVYTETHGNKGEIREVLDDFNISVVGERGGQQFLRATNR